MTKDQLVQQVDESFRRINQIAEERMKQRELPPSNTRVSDAFNKAVERLGELFSWKQLIREVGGQQAGLERYRLTFSGQTFSEVNELLHELGVAIRESATGEPPAEPVAWMSSINPGLVTTIRYEGESANWVPLYRAAQPPADDLPIHTVVESLRDERRKRCFEGECARTACTNRPAVYFNSSTLWYYCGSCAAQINQYAQKELCVIAPGGHEALARAGLTKRAESAESTYECINKECGWVGLKSETLHPKHAVEDMLCPECHEVVELDSP